MKLYELTEQYNQLLDLDMPDDMIADSLEALTGEIEIKAENMMAVISNMKADVSALDTEIKRLTQRKKSIQNREDSLREYLRFNMEVSGITKINCPLFTITLCAPSDIVVIDDLDQLPECYVKVTKSADKVAIKNDIASGTVVPGAHIDKGMSALMIR